MLDDCRVYKRLLKFKESFILAIVRICLGLLPPRAESLKLLLWDKFTLLLLLTDYLSLVSFEVTDMPLLLPLEKNAFLSTYRAESLIKVRALFKVDLDLCILWS